MRRERERERKKERERERVWARVSCEGFKVCNIYLELTSIGDNELYT